MKIEMDINLPFFSSLFDWILKLGSLSGLISVIFIIIKYRKEKPILKVSPNLFHYITTLDNISYLIIINGRITIDNVGEKDTTIKNIEIEVKFDKDMHSDTITFDSFNISSNSSMDHDVNTNFWAKKEYEKLNILFTIHHTHGKKSFKTTSILRGDITENKTTVIS